MKLENALAKSFHRKGAEGAKKRRENLTLRNAAFSAPPR